MRRIGRSRWSKAEEDELDELLARAQRLAEATPKLQAMKGLVQDRLNQTTIPQIREGIEWLLLGLGVREVSGQDLSEDEEKWALGALERITHTSVLRRASE